MCTSQSSKESTVAIALRLLSAELIDEIFSTCPVGNIKRDHEEAILVNFNHFLEEVENGLVHYVGDKNDLLLTLRSVLSFITGAKNIPAVGFSTAFKIVFDHEAPLGRKMTANTCANVITFPVNNIYMEYDLFKNEMITCIQDCQGFGMV